MKGSETFIKTVYDEADEILKQEPIAVSTKELNFRNLVLNYHPNHEAQQQKINVYRDGVYLVNRKTEPVYEALEKSDTPSHSKPRLAANRSSHKEKLEVLSSFSFSSLFSTNSDSNGLKNQQQEKLMVVKHDEALSGPLTL